MSCLLRALNTAEMPDVIPLTAYERRRKAELEAVVSAGLETFLKVGHALAEIRSKRLFRTEYPTFKLYCRNKFSLAPSSADQLIRTAQTAGVLLKAGVNLSGAMEAAIRPLCSFSDPDLQSAC